MTSEVCRRRPPPCALTSTAGYGLPERPVPGPRLTALHFRRTPLGLAGECKAQSFRPAAKTPLRPGLTVLSAVLFGSGQGGISLLSPGHQECWVSHRQVVCFNLEGPGSCAADQVSSWHRLLEVSEPNLWPTPSKWIKVYGMFILY